LEIDKLDGVSEVRIISRASTGAAPLEATLVACRIGGAKLQISVPERASWSSSPAVFFVPGADGGTLIGDPIPKKRRWAPHKHFGPAGRTVLETCIWISMDVGGLSSHGHGQPWKICPQVVTDMLVGAMSSIQARLKRYGRLQDLNVVGFSRGAWWVSHMASTGTLPAGVKNLVVIGGYPVLTPHEGEMRTLGGALVPMAFRVVAIGSYGDVCSPPKAYMPWYDAIAAAGGCVHLLSDISHEGLYDVFLKGIFPETTDVVKTTVTTLHRYLLDVESVLIET